jgi:hypothetical protein
LNIAGGLMPRESVNEVLKVDGVMRKCSQAIANIPLILFLSLENEDLRVEQRMKEYLKIELENAEKDLKKISTFFEFLEVDLKDFNSSWESVCDICKNSIFGNLVKVKDHDLHVRCFLGCFERTATSNQWKFLSSDNFTIFNHDFKSTTKFNGTEIKVVTVVGEENLKMLSTLLNPKDK